MLARHSAKSSGAWIVGLSVLLYLAWTLATYWFEGRVHLLQQPTPIGRAVYVVIANILIGVFAVGWLMRSAVVDRIVHLDQLGFCSLRRSLIAIVLALVGGFAMFILLNPPSLEPLVVWNVFAQVLPTTIAEIQVCWVALGVSVEAATANRGRIVSILLAVVAADVAFGVYHFGHSEPFNQWPVVVFLMGVGLITSLVYFLTRDVYATIIIHNFLGMKGVMSSMDLAFLRQPLYPLYIILVLSVAALIAVHWWLARRTQGEAHMPRPMGWRPVG